MIRGFEPGRALEVIQPKYGSAYRIGGRLVLTAAHLLAEVGSDCRVRSKQSFGETEARVVWKASQADIALIELPESITACEAVVFGLLPTDQKGENLKFQMYGWPRWGTTQREDRLAAGGRQVEGIIYLADTSAENLLVLEPQRLPPETPSDGRSHWEGNSGAAIVCEGRVIAVQTQHQKPIRPASLEASPLWTIYSDEQWCSLLSQHGIDPQPEKIELDITPELLKGGGHYHYREQVHQPPSKFNVAYPHNDYFTGREIQLENLHQIFETSSVAALFGLGGIGKTQTAVEYVYSYRKSYEWVFWVNADELSLASDFGKLALAMALPEASLKLDEQIEAVKRWLKAQTDVVLLVFDNADKPELLKSYLPNNPNVKVLLTSRVPVFDLLGIANPIELEKLTLKQSIQFLFNRTGRLLISEGKREADPEFFATERLAQELDGLPLALEQAGAFIKELDISFASYLTQYEELRLVLLEEQKPVVGDYPESVRTTWTLNFQAVAKRSLASAQVLELSAFLAPDDIPYELLVLGAKHLGDEIHLVLADPNKLRTETVLARLLKPLSDYSLIQRKREKQSYSIHRLVQEVLRDRLEKSGYQQWIKQLVNALAEVFPFGDFEDWQQCARLLSHVQTIRQHLKHYPYTSLSSQYLLNSIAHYLKEQEQYEEALKAYEEALEIAEHFIGKYGLIDNFDQLVEEIFLSKVKEQEMIEMLQKVFRIEFSKKLNKYFHHTRSILNNIAEIYFYLENYEKAEKLYQEVIEHDRKEIEYLQENTDEANYVNEVCLDMAKTLNNLGRLYDSQRQYSAAKLAYLEALRIRKKYLGIKNLDFVEILHNLALSYKRQRNYKNAERLYKYVLKIRQTRLGTHPDVAIVLNNLAELYREQNCYNDAKIFHEEALEMRRLLYQEALKTQKPSQVLLLALARSLQRLADIYYLQAHYREAEPLYREALEIQEQNLQDNHSDLALTQNHLAECYREQNILSAEAENLYRKALDTWRSKNEYFNLAVVLNNLGLFCEAQERYRDAEIFYDELLQILMVKLEGNHPDSETFYHNVLCFLVKVVQEGRATELVTPVMKQLLMENKFIAKYIQ